MSKAVSTEDIAAVCAALGQDPARGQHLAAGAARLYAQGMHQHGLTRTARPLVELAAALRQKAPEAGLDAERIGRVLRQQAPWLSATQRAIVAEAVTHRPPPGPQAPPGEPDARQAALHEVARRIAAVVDAAQEGAETAVPALPPDASGADVARRVLRIQWEAFASRLYGLPYEEDIEYVHEMRVALRRLWAALRAFRRMLDGLVPELRRGVRCLADALGKVRDSDVLLAFLRDYAARAQAEHLPWLRGLLRAERRKRRRHFRALIAKLESEECAAFRTRCDAMLTGRAVAEGLSPASSAADEPLALRAPRMLLKELAALRKFKRNIRKLSPEQQHTLRIHCKRLRYTAEFLAGLYPSGLAKIIEPMIAMQDALGDVHDSDVYIERVERYDRRCRAGREVPGRAEAQAALLAFLAQRRERALEEAAAAWRKCARDKSLAKAAKAIG